MQDEFAGIDQRLYLGPALGYKILTGPKHLLSAEGGVDYDNEPVPDDLEETDTILSVALIVNFK